MIRFDRDDLNKILGDFLGKPWQKAARGPDAYDCYGLVRAFAERLGLDLPEIGAVDPGASGEAYKGQQANYTQLEWARPWSLVTFCHDLEAHVGIVLPHDNLFLHCPRRGAGRVMAEPLNRRPWRDSIDGYWWPKGCIETVVILSPINNARRAWQFVRAGRTLAEIIERDIVEGRDITVQAFLDGQEVPQEAWGDTVPVESQQLAIRPIAEGGKQAAMVAGMLALAVIAPYAAGALSGVSAGAGGALVTSTGALATTGQVFAYQALTAGVMMAGGVALSALVGADEADQDDSQAYALNPTTTQQVGSMVPLVYGTYGVKGNIVCSYLHGTTVLGDKDTWAVERVWNPVTSRFETRYYNAGEVQFIHYATSTLYTKIAYSDGPIQGIVAGTELLNGRDPSYYDGDDDFAVEHFTGTDSQAASSVPDGFELPVNLRIESDEDPVTKVFTAVRCDAVSIVLRFDNSFTRLHSDGSHVMYHVGLVIEVQAYGDASWHTLVSETIRGDCYTSGVRLSYDFSGTYTGGSAYTITPGTTYVVRVTRTTEARRGNELFYFDSILCSYNERQRLPGIAYTAISAAASEDLSGALDYYAEIQGKLVRVYDSTTETWSIEWSDNPAWVAFDLLTRPVVSGDGNGTPYAVEYYRRLDPSYLILDDFVAFAAWCDELVPDGEGATEKRYRFNGVFDQDGSAWQQVIRVCKMACAMPYFQGHNIGIVIDKPGTPAQMFNVSNLRGGFNETWIDTSEAATVADVDFNDETSEYGPETYPVPLAGSSEDIPVSLDGFGHTKRSQVYRWAGRQLRINKYMKRTVEIPACLDAVWTRLGDIVYVQHPALNRATGGRIVEVYADGVKLDKPVDVGYYDSGVVPAGSQHTTADYGLRLFAKTPLRLGQCTVNALAAGTLTVKVHKYVHGSGITGSAVATRTFSVTAGENVIDLDIYLPANETGQEYLLYRSGSFSLLRTSTAISWTGLDFANVTFIGGGTATGLVTVAQYYYFFNLHVSNPCTDYALLVRTHDGTAERLTLYDVAAIASEDNDIVTISGTWEYTPNPNDLWTFGEETKVIDLYRVKGFERTGDGRVTIQAAQYSTDYYTEDEEPPKIEAQTYTTNKGGFSPAMLPTTAAALSAVLPDTTQNMDTIALSGIAFTGNGTTTVTWTCESTGGEGVRYRGQWCPILDDATGTTDRYIYFDPGIITPYNLQHTDDLADLVGQERYVLCENVGGVAYPKGGILMTVEEEKLDGIEENADVTADNPISTFRETFWDPNGDYLTRWTVGGTGETSLVSGGVAGGKYLHCGDNADVDRVSLTYFRKIAFDPDKLYRMKVRVRRTAGAGALYCGIIGYDSAGAAVNPTGQDAHWVCAKGAGPSTEWTTYIGYFKGHSAEGVWTACPSASSPATLKAGVTQFAVKAYLNYNTAGIMDLDEVAIDILPNGADEVPESETRKWAGESGADVTANNAVSIIHHGDTEPENPQEGWIWYDSSANPTVVKRYSGTEWIILGVDLKAWCHAVDKTKLDGSNLYPSTVTTDALAANSVTAAKILVEKLSAICAVIGDLVGGSITGSTITGGILRTATANRRVVIDGSGIRLLSGAIGYRAGTVAAGGSGIRAGTVAAGGSGAVAGSDTVATLNNTTSGRVLDIRAEQASIADLHIPNRTTDPSSGQQDDIALVNGKWRRCTVAGTPATWVDVG